MTQYQLQLRFLLIAALLICVGAVWPAQAQAKVLNARDFGALGNGKHDDTTALQKAIEAAGMKKGGGVLVIPAGKYIITHTITLKHMAGVIIRGQGNVTISPYFGKHISATNLIWDGPAGGVMFHIEGGHFNVIKNICFIGRDRSDKKQKGQAGTLWLQTHARGDGGGQSSFLNLTFRDADVGIHMGKMDNGKGAMCADLNFQFLEMFNLHTGFLATQNQSVHFLFNFVFAQKCDQAFYFKYGGDAQVNQGYFIWCDSVLRLGFQGSQTGQFVLIGCHQEQRGHGKRQQLLTTSLTKPSEAIVEFINYCDASNPFRGSETEHKLPLCEIGPGVKVIFDSSIIYSALARIEGTKSHPSELIVRGSTIPDPTKVIAANEYGYFKTINCRWTHAAPQGKKLQPMANVSKWPVLSRP